MNDMSSTICKLRTDTTFQENSINQMREEFGETTETDFQFASNEVHGGDPEAGVMKVLGTVNQNCVSLVYSGAVPA